MTLIIKQGLQLALLDVKERIIIRCLP